MEKFWTDNYPEGVLKDVDSNQYSSLTHLFDDMFALYADREFSTNMEVTYTYAQIDAIARDISAWLQAQGLKKGDKVAIMMPNVNQYIPIAIAILRAGFVVTSVNPMYSARELKHQLHDTQASILFILKPFCHTLEKIIDDSQIKTVVVSKIGDMLSIAKGIIVNLMAKHVKKAVPSHNLKSNSQYIVTDFKTVAVGTLNPIVAKADFTGKISMPLPGIDMTIRDDDENELAIGEIGEICLKGDNVTKGYNNMDSSSYFTHDGYLKTGDIGAIGEDGYVTLYDRKKDMLIVSGFNVFPNEVEGVIGMHPKVSECGVVGIDDSKRGQAIKVFVVRSDKSLTKDELM